MLNVIERFYIVGVLALFTLFFMVHPATCKMQLISKNIKKKPLQDSYKKECS